MHNEPNGKSRQELVRGIGFWIGLLLVLTPFCISHAATYYVSTTGTDSDLGTLSRPWRTVGKAASNTAIRPGDTVYVRGGVYNEAVTITISGSAGSNITFAAYPGETPILDGTGITPPQDTDTGLFLMTDQSWLTIQGFELRNYKTSSVNPVPAGIFLRGACQNILIQKCNIHDIWNTGGNTTTSGNAFGIAVYGSSTTPATAIVIDGNELHNLKTGSSECLSINGNVINFQVTNNLVHDSNNIGIVCIGFESTCPDPAQDQARNGICRGNTVWNISSQGNQAYANGDYGADGLYCDGATNITMERNISHDNDIGVELSSEHAGKLTSNIRLRDNFVFNNRQTGLFLGGYASNGTGGTDGCTITNNSFFGNDTLLWGNGEIQLRWRTSNCVLRNNALYSNSQNLLVTVPVAATNNVNNTFDYNLYYCASGSSASTWSWNNKTATGFAAWNKNSGQDAHSLFADPKFANTTQGFVDLHLQLNSPAIDTGDPAFLSGSGELDIDGGPRITGVRVDIGADELTPFDAWKVLHFGANAPNNLVAGPLANPAKDNTPNMIKYGLGLDPLANTMTGLPTPVVTNGYLTFTFTRNKAATDITVVAEVSSDLVNWSSNAVDVDQQWQVIDGTTLQTLTARDKTLNPPATKRFMRLKVSTP